MLCDSQKGQVFTQKLTLPSEVLGDMQDWVRKPWQQKMDKETDGSNIMKESVEQEPCRIKEKIMPSY